MPIMSELLREVDASFEAWATESPESFPATSSYGQLAYHSAMTHPVNTDLP